MLLTIDIGNTTTALGLFKGRELLRHLKFPSSLKEDAEGLYRRIKAFIEEKGIIRRENIKAAIACSVVPSLDGKMRAALTRLFGKRVSFLGEDFKAPMPIITGNTTGIGADRLANAVGAYDALRQAVIVVDMGTAITVDLVTDKGEFAGGAIAPGAGISMEALFSRTAQLPRVEPRRPERALGRDTESAIVSGIYFGFRGLVEGITRAIMDELGKRPPVMATGGLSQVFSRESRYITHTDEFLTLKGLNIMYNEVQSGD